MNLADTCIGLDNLEKARAIVLAYTDAAWLDMFLAQEHPGAKHTGEISEELQKKIAAMRAEDMLLRDAQLKRYETCRGYLQKALNCVRANNALDGEMHLTTAMKISSEIRQAYGLEE